MPHLVEVGCGAGFSSRYLDGSYDSFLGIDYSAELIGIADRLHTRDDVRFECANVRDFEPRQAIDAIVMIGVLHHLDAVAEMMLHLKSLLRPGGLLIVNEPQRANPVVSALRALRKRTDHNYSEDQVEFSAREIRDLYRDAGFDLLAMSPQGLFSTPFAEVPLRPDWWWSPISMVACAADSTLERLPGWTRSLLAWNVIAVGRRPLST